MPDKRILEQLMTMLRGLRAQVRLFDEHGECLSGGESEVLPEFPQMGMAVVRDGWTWIRTMTNAIPYICVEGEDAAASDCARLAAALAESMMREPSATTRDDVLRGALREDMPEPELVTLATEYGIPSDEERCAMLFHGTASVIREVIAVGEGDALVEMDRHALVLIKSMRNIEGYDDLIQLAAAIEQVKKVSARLRETGWKIASHSYTHNSYFRDGTITLDEMKIPPERGCILLSQPGDGALPVRAAAGYRPPLSQPAVQPQDAAPFQRGNAADDRHVLPQGSEPVRYRAPAVHPSQHAGLSSGQDSAPDRPRSAQV